MKNYLYFHYPVMNIWVSMVTQLQSISGWRPWDGLAKSASQTVMWFVICSACTASYSRSPHEKSGLLWGRYLRAQQCFHAGEWECATQLAKKSTAVSWCMFPVFFHHKWKQRVWGVFSAGHWSTIICASGIWNCSISLFWVEQHCWWTKPNKSLYMRGIIC